MKLLKIILMLFLMTAYSAAMGSGLFFMYDLGLKESLKTLYELPYIPLYSFIVIYAIILYFGTLYNKNNQKSYKISDPEPYSKLLSNILTLYIHVCAIWIFYLIF